MMQKKIRKSLVTVLNPQGQPAPGLKPRSIMRESPHKKEEKRGDTSAEGMKPLSMAPRLDTLEGKTVYLVDAKFGGGYEFLKEMQGWFSKNMPTVKTILRPKVGDMFVDDTDLWAEIKGKGDAVILGVGG